MTDEQAAMKWYVVTGRRNGDDEDELFITQADDQGDAMIAFRDYLRNRDNNESLDFSDECDDNPRLLIYVNHIVVCDTEPEHTDWPG